VGVAVSNEKSPEILTLKSINAEVKVQIHAELLL
jgi:hypothetical protein